MKNRYLIRALKYLVYLLLIFGVLFLILVLTGYSSWHSLSLIWHTDRIWLLVAAFILLPGIYPIFGYIKREMRLNFAEKRELLERVLTTNNYRIESETPDGLTARAVGSKRFALLLEDRIVITSEGNYIRIEGPRKEVVKLEYRLKTFM